MGGFLYKEDSLKSKKNKVIEEISDFVMSYVANKKSAKTYLSNILMFIKENPDFMNYDDKTLRDKIVLFIAKRPRSYTRKFALKILLIYLKKESIYLQLPKPKLLPRKILSKQLSFQQIKTLVNSAPTKTLKLIMMLRYETAARINALLNLRKRDIVVSENGDVKIILKEKGGYIRTIFLSESTGKFLLDFVKNKKFDDFIFKSKWKSKYWWFLYQEQRLARKYLGINISTHWFRHSRIMHLFEAGYDMQEIQRITGHKSLDSLRRYLEESGMSTKEILEKEKPKW